jgi:hypothetical protein
MTNTLRTGLFRGMTNSIKPLSRWTFGYCGSVGQEILRHSIKRFSIIYPEFDKVVCYNNLKPGQLEFLESLEVPLHEQTEADLGYPLVPANFPPGWKHSMAGWGWKLCPPRLRPESHELWIDNDMVIRHRLPSIDLWLQLSTTLICEGLKRAYGDFDHLIAEGTPYCAGMFGLPPLYDFKSQIKIHCNNLNGKPLGYYNEQGVVVLSMLPDTIVVPLTELLIVKQLIRPYPSGLHFIGANRTNWHIWWERYKCCTLI